MNPQTRNLLIQRVIDSLATVGPGSIFERFAVVMVERLQGVKLNQRGSSVGGSPVGGALDATSEDGRIVVEASIEKGYFTGAMVKAWGDLEHTLQLAPLAQDIYLLSSRRAETGVIEAMVYKAMAEKRMSDRRLHLMDSRTIAETIVDVLMVRDDAIDELAQHLPILAEIRDDHPSSLNAPPLNDRYVRNDAVDAELDRRLQIEACIEIGGIGGIGKSQAAAACLQRSSERFHHRFWVSGRDIDGVERLSSVPVRRGGAERNVTALLRRNPSFLVIDDASPSLAVDQLAQMCGPDSRILITRQASSSSAYAMPTMDIAQSAELLASGLAAPPPPHAFDAIWNAVGGHPLSLSLLNSAAREGVSWDELAEDCTHLGKLQVGGARLADRVLGRLRPSLGEELSFFQWAGQSHCDRAFFKKVVGTLRLKSFEQHGLTAPESDASIRIHDIVFAALRSLNWLTVERSREIDGHLEAFILEQIRSDGHGLQLIAAQLRRKIESNVAAGDRRPAFLYALATIWLGSAPQVGLLPDPVTEARRLKPLSAAANEISILVVLESIEAKARFIRHESGDDAGASWLNACLGAYGDLGAIADLTARQAAEIKHHHAKTLRALGRGAEANPLFEEVVASQSLNDARLQLVRSYSLKPECHEKARRYASEIISAKLEGSGVSPSLLMALGDALNGARQSWARELLEQHEGLFLAEALYSAAIGIAQGYHSVAGSVRALVWHAPERVKDVLSRLPEPTPLMLDDDQSRGGYAEIMLLAPGVEDETERLNRALEAFETLKSPNSYQKRKWGEALYRLGRHSEAEQILQEIDDKSGRPWVAHLLSQVKMDLGKLPEALELVDESVAGAVGQHEKYLSSFLLQRVKVKIALNVDPSADISEGLLHTKNSGLLEQFHAFQARVQSDSSAPS